MNQLCLHPVFPSILLHSVFFLFIMSHIPIQTWEYHVVLPCQFTWNAQIYSKIHNNINAYVQLSDVRRFVVITKGVAYKFCILCTIVSVGYVCYHEIPVYPYLGQSLVEIENGKFCKQWTNGFVYWLQVPFDSFFRIKSSTK